MGKPGCRCINNYLRSNCYDEFDMNIFYKRNNWFLPTGFIYTLRVIKPSKLVDNYKILFAALLLHLFD